MADPCRYWAFISYSHHDRRVAKRLHERLQKSRVPRSARGRLVGDPHHFMPIYLDRQEAGPGSHLTHELQEALRASQKLIVICSPFAVQSSYVANEVAYFQEIGRAEDILCVIASGVPNAADRGHPELECFPAPLREREVAEGEKVAVPESERPLAADLEEESAEDWDRVVAQLRAGLSDLTLGELRREEDKAHLVRLGGFGAAVLAAAAALGWASWAYLLPDATYARNMVRVGGVWQEVDLISKSTARRRELSYRFERRGAYGRIHSVKLVNSAGHCPADGMRSLTNESSDRECNLGRACEIRLAYGSDGLVVSEQRLDQRGNVLETMSYPRPDVGVMSEAVVGCSPSTSGITILTIRRFPQGSPHAGREQMILFQGGPDRSARPNANYEYGYRFRYDSAGRVLETLRLGPDARPASAADGFAIETRTYTVTGDLLRLDRFDAQGQAAADNKGVARVVYGLDGDGNVLDERYFDAASEAVLNGQGVHGLRHQRDRGGMIRSTSRIGLSGATTFGSDGAARIDYELGPQGDMLGKAFFDVTGRPTFDKEGCGRYRYKRGRGGELLEKACFDEGGRPVVSAGGYYRSTQRADDRGNVLETSYFDEGGRLTFNKQLYASLRTQWNSNNHLVAKRVYGPDGKLTLAEDGVAGRLFRRDRFGRSIAELHLGLDGRPGHMSKEGVAGVRLGLDEFGRERVIQNLGRDGKIVFDKKGEAQRVRAFDRLGRVVRDANFDESGKPALDITASSLGTFDYDDARRTRTITAFDTEGRRTQTRQGWSRWIEAKDARGALIREEFFDTSDARIRASEGCAIRTYTPDRYGRQIETRCLDVDERLILDSDGVAIIRTRNDRLGNAPLVTYFGSDGRPVLSKQGYHGVRSVYNRRGQQISQTFLGLDGKPIFPAGGEYATARHVYDAKGNDIRIEFLDAPGRPTGGSYGVFARRLSYDERGRVVEEQNLGADGRIVADETADPIQLSRYDDAGNGIETRVLNASRLPVSANRALIRRAFDRFGRETKVRFYAADGSLFSSAISGRAGADFSYDRYGRLIEERSVGTRGEPVDRRDVGWWVKRTRYDARGAYLGEQCLKVSGGSIPCPPG